MATMLAFRIFSTIEFFKLVQANVKFQLIVLGSKLKCTFSLEKQNIIYTQALIIHLVIKLQVESNNLTHVHAVLKLM